MWNFNPEMKGRMMKCFFKVVAYSVILLTSAFAGQGGTKQVDKNDESPKKYKVILEDAGYYKYLKTLKDMHLKILTDVLKLDKDDKIGICFKTPRLNVVTSTYFLPDEQTPITIFDALTLAQINSGKFVTLRKTTLDDEKEEYIETLFEELIRINNGMYEAVHCPLFPKPISEPQDGKVTCIEIFIKAKEEKGFYYPTGELAPLIPDKM
jgi:hypothetical protein